MFHTYNTGILVNLIILNRVWCHLNSKRIFSFNCCCVTKIAMQCAETKIMQIAKRKKNYILVINTDIDEALHNNQI